MDNSQEIQPIEEKTPRCTAIEKQARLDEVVDMMCKFHSNNEILKFLQEKYQLTRKGAEPYLTEAREIIIGSIPNPQEVVGKHIQAYERIAKRNEGNDDRTAMIAQASIEKLLKLHLPDIQVNNNTMNINMESVDIQDILQAVKQLKQKEE